MPNMFSLPGPEHTARGKARLALAQRDDARACGAFYLLEPPRRHVKRGARRFARAAVDADYNIITRAAAT